MKVKLCESLPAIEAAWWKPTYVGFDDDHGRVRVVCIGNLIGSSWESTEDAHRNLQPADAYPFGARRAYIRSSTAEVVS